MTTKLRILLVFFILFTLGYQVFAASKPSPYECSPSDNEKGQWQLDLFDRVKGSSFNYRDVSVPLNRPGLKDTGSELIFTSDEASLTLDHTKSTTCDFASQGDNYCWEAKINKLKDINKDIGRKRLKELIATKWICYGK